MKNSRTSKIYKLWPCFEAKTYSILGKENLRNLNGFQNGPPGELKIRCLVGVPTLVNRHSGCMKSGSKNKHLSKRLFRQSASYAHTIEEHE